MNPTPPIPVPAVRQLAGWLAVAAGLLALAGCESPESHVVSAPPPGNPVVVATQPPPVVVTSAPAAGAIVVTQAPPALQQEVVQARPSSEHVWLPGYWSWRNNRYEWVAGHWEVPPRVNAVWAAPHWERLGDGSYRFYEGSWE